MDALLLAIGLLVGGGLTALLLSRLPLLASALGAGSAVLGGVIGLVPAFRVLVGGDPESLRLAWDPTHGDFRIELDPLSAFFLVPVLVLSALAAIYGAQYLLAFRDTKSLGGAWFFFNLFVAGMVLVLIARTVLLFLVAWEVMSISAYLLVTFEHEKAEVRRAGWIYLIATHLGVIFLFVAFLLLGRHAGGMDFEAFREVSDLSGGWTGLVFVLALVGFGAKAGFVPFHVWLPEAHPAAPSHVSALMSGVMIKMGLYGILRIASFLGPPPTWWGLTLAGLGLLTALVGIALALNQRDVKRVLAYSSIENIGLIALVLGVGLWGAARGDAMTAMLGMTAAFLHIWNHALMKGLMFLAAGSILHGAGTKDMEKLGGLMRTMPWTAAALLFGAVALAALPPLNGFVSKWLIYLSLLQGGLSSTDDGSLGALLVVGLLALIGGLCAITYVRLTGIVLLGSPRSDSARHAHESSWWILGPMYVLMVLCLMAAVMPQVMEGLLPRALRQAVVLRSGPALPSVEDSAAPLSTIGVINVGTLIVLVVGALGLRALTRRGRTEGATWGCGYVAPTPRMQYTGRSFAEIMTEYLLPRFLRPRTHRQAPAGLFPPAGAFEVESPDPVSEKVYEPFFRRWANRFARLRVLQQGRVHVYLIYIVFMVVLALAWVSIRRWWSA